MSSYRFATGHPFTPARHELAVELMRAWGLLDAVPTIEPAAAGVDDLLGVHSPQLIEAVRAASERPDRADPRFGIGPGDTPAFAGMHEAALAVVGSTLATVEAVVDGRARCAFGPAGGLHHAHRDRSAGFCIYNDVAVAIARTTAEHPGLRVAYVDVDVHHGDGVEEAFYERSDVLTLSVHESGAYLYPGSGHVHDMGRGAGHGFAVNVPLLPGAGSDCYDLVLRSVIEPALCAFGPQLIVVQGGGDTHRDDPLATLDNTVAGYVDLVRGIARVANDICDGALAMVGGGGYESYSAVPRMWAAAMAVLAGVPVPEVLPQEWRDRSNEAARAAGSSAPQAPLKTFAEGSAPAPAHLREAALEAAQSTAEKIVRTHPLFER